MILCIGDSWTKGWGVGEAETWPKLLERMTRTPVVVMAEHGACNSYIHELYNEGMKKYDPDYVIIGWSGVSRYEGIGDLSEVFSIEKEIHRKKFFRNQTLKTFADDFNFWVSSSPSNFQFSVFGDQNLIRNPKVHNTSFFEFLAKKAGYDFQYEIPFFEFDYLNEDNKVAQEFFERNRVPNWRRACVERELVREEDRTYFLECGHPNAAGHKLWAEYIHDRMGHKWQ